MDGSSGILLAILLSATGAAAASGYTVVEALQAGLMRAREVWTDIATSALRKVAVGRWKTIAARPGCAPARPASRICMMGIPVHDGRRCRGFGGTGHEKMHSFAVNC